MENQAPSPAFEPLSTRICQLETDLRTEKEKNSHLIQTIAMQKLLMEELAEKAELVLEAEYRAIMKEHEEGKSVDGPGLMRAISNFAGAD